MNGEQLWEQFRKAWYEAMLMEWTDMEPTDQAVWNWLAHEITEEVLRKAYLQ